IVAKSCSRSHGQPVTGVRSAAMISMRREISREGVMAFPSAWENEPLYAASGATIPAERTEIGQFPPIGLTARECYWPPYERPIIVRNRTGAVFRRAGFHHLPGLGLAALCPRRNARLQLRPAPRDRAGMPRPAAVGHHIAAAGLGGK